MNDSMNERILFRFLYGVSGALVGGFVGLVVSWLNGIIGADKSIIILGFALTGGFLVAAFPNVVTFIASIFSGGDSDAGLGLDIEIENSEDIRIDTITPDQLPNGKRSPWGRHKSK